MEYQPAQVRAQRMTRINWTQTTTVTVAAFLGCLAAVALIVFLFNSRLGKGIKQRMARLDQLDRMIDESEDELAVRNERNELLKRRPVTAMAHPLSKGATILSQPDDDEDKDETNDQAPAKKEPQGDPIETTPAV